jgi:hypothetical protein
MIGMDGMFLAALRRRGFFAACRNAFSSTRDSGKSFRRMYEDSF